ncbi:hypothetical protein BT63DRAFT_305419 [Microthyrium microscopicum]|uniref:Uncharacterized protein n=1 Tax=Microthyrium microscopicum TaxID=703497 RepID=A0A6A6U912_9PEZI|nr:hypothetical protein BT63DRAFT_305419 [Microthyrium microscopicum]
MHAKKGESIIQDREAVNRISSDGLDRLLRSEHEARCFLHESRSWWNSFWDFGLHLRHEAGLEAELELICELRFCETSDWASFSRRFVYRPRCCQAFSYVQVAQLACSGGRLVTCLVQPMR